MPEFFALEILFHDRLRDGDVLESTSNAHAINVLLQYPHLIYKQ